MVRSSQLLGINEEDAFNIYLETSSIMFERFEFDGFIKFTEINPYGGLFENDISDIVVVGKNKEAVDTRFAYELVLSERRRGELESFFEGDILPFIQTLRNSGWIVAAGRRGDLIVPTRHPTPWSNINVSLVTCRETEELIEELQKSSGTIEVLNFGERGRGRNISEIIVERGEPRAFYDVWTKGKLEEWLKSGEWKKYRYFSQLLRHFIFLWDDTNQITKLFYKTRELAEKLSMDSLS